MYLSFIENLNENILLNVILDLYHTISSMEEIFEMLHSHVFTPRSPLPPPTHTHPKLFHDTGNIDML